MSDFRLSDFDYALPAGLIAQHPTRLRSGSRLLHVPRAADATRLDDRRFADLPALLRPGDLLVFNDTRVVPARIAATKASGGRVLLLLERILAADEALFQFQASHAPRAGAWLSLEGGARAEVVLRSDRFIRLRFEGGLAIDAYLDAHGKLPLPPYVSRPVEAEDATRYQTVYARHPGAVAAPTAGLHFDDAMLARLAAVGIEQAYLTLHVGSATFLPVTTEDLSLHRMHAERYHLADSTIAAIAAARARGGRVVAIGTTTLRALESAASGGTLAAGDAETSLFITPGYRFRVVDMLLSNFHLPRSTLLMLVSAFAGPETIRDAYAHAIAQHYRFYSFGDAMLISRAKAP